MRTSGYIINGTFGSNYTFIFIYSQVVYYNDMAPQDDVQAIKDRLNIADVVSQYIQLRRAGRNFVARCPFHKERTPSFHVSPERGTYICFGCGEKGDIFSFVERIEGVDFRTALEELAKKAGVTLHQGFTPKPENKEKDARLRDVCEAAAKFYEVQLSARSDVAEYLHARAVSQETVALWRLGYAPAQWRSLTEHLASLGFSKDDMVEAGLAIASRGQSEVYDRFRGRVMFPICDTAGRVVAFSGRFFEKMIGSHDEEHEPAKYVNSPETLLFKKSRVLYGFHIAKSAMRRADCILLVEGQFDLILAHQSGLPFTVALSGTALTQEHLVLLGRLSKRLVLALDADAAGVRSGLRSTHLAIEHGFDVKIPTFPQGKDPADVAKESAELLKAAVRTSKTAIEFFLDILRSGAKDERTYKRIVEAQVLPLIAAMGSKIEQEHFIRLVAAKLSVSEAAVREEVSKKKSVPVYDLPGPGDAEVAAAQDSAELTALQKKIAMLLSYFSAQSDIYARLQDLVGKDRLDEVHRQIANAQEEWRFRFEAELHDDTSEQTVAADMLSDIERSAAKERVKMKYL